MKLRVPYSAIVGAVVVVAALLTGFMKDDSGDELRRIGGAAAASLEDYTRAHRACPPTLEAVGLTLPPRFRFRVWNGGSKCEISGGDYGLNGFEVYWLYPPGKWSLNRD